MMDNKKKWQIYNDLDGELVICTDFNELSFGCEFNPICSTNYYDDEEFAEAMANFEEIVKAHNDKLEVKP